MRMIALVSDQRMQNLIPLLQHGASYHELLLILSKERGHGQPSKRFVDATSDMGAVIASLRPDIRVSTCATYVDPYDIQSSKAIVDALIAAPDDRASTVVNISGGTK